MDEDVPQKNRVGLKKIIILFIVFVVLIAAAIFFQSNFYLSNQMKGVKENSGFFLFFLVISAFIDSINPCAISVLLLTIAFLLSMGKDRASIMKIGGVYIFGIFLVYVLIGLGILRALIFFQTPHFMAKIGAGLVIVFGIIEIIGEWYPKFPIRLGIPHKAHTTLAKYIERSSIPAAFILGGLVSMFEFPCTGGPYLTILGLLRDKNFILGSYMRGLVYLVIYNLIFILPLVIILFLASEKSLIEKIQHWKKEKTGSLKFWTGIAMILLGAVIILL